MANINEPNIDNIGSGITGTKTKTGTRRPFPQMNSLRDFVVNEFTRRKTSYPAPVSAPFIRLVSCKEGKENSYRFFTLGLHGYDGNDSLFDLTYGQSRDIVGYAYDTGDSASSNGKLKRKFIYTNDISMGDISKFTPAEKSLNVAQGLENQQQNTVSADGRHPIPGIIDVSIKRQALNAPLRANVKWVCYNKQQLEFLRHHFMLAGSYVILEWGQNFADSHVSHLLDYTIPGDQLYEELKQCLDGGRNYIIDNYVEPNNGNYDFLIGMIGNFNVEYSARNNIYTVTTEIASQGDMYFGISTSTTFVSADAPGGYVSSIKDFFKGDDGPFMQLIQNGSAINDGKITYFVSDDAPQKNIIVDDQLYVVSSQDDYAFIRWDYFTTIILENLLDIIRIPESRKLLESFLKFTKRQATSQADEIGRTTPVGPLESTGLEFVGNNPNLLSVKEDVMIIARKPLPKVRNFKPFSDQNFGILGQGIWINAGAIKRAFASSATFDQAMTNLLVDMNIASAQYWALRLYYDETVSELKIVDEKYGSLTDVPFIYKFNEGPVGESLNIEFDSAFPPELQTMMMLSATYNSLSTNKQQEFLEKYPTIGTTAHYAFALNWTDLVDGFRNYISSHTPPGPSTEPIFGQFGGYTSQNPDAAVRITSKVTDSSTKLGAVQTLQNPGAAAAIGGNTVQNNPTTDPFSSGDVAQKPTVSSQYPVTSDIKIDEKQKVVYNKIDQYQHIIETESQRLPQDKLPGVNRISMVKAIIAGESNGTNQFGKPYTRKGVSEKAIGLMQVTLGSAAPGIKVPIDNYESDPTVQSLYSPDNNIHAGVSILIDKINTEYGRLSTDEKMKLSNGDTSIGNIVMKGAVSGYHGGKLNRGTDPIQWCYSRDINGSCTKWVQSNPGEYTNYPYVNTYLQYYNSFNILDSQREKNINSFDLQDRQLESISGISTNSPYTIEQSQKTSGLVRKETLETQQDFDTKNERISEIGKTFGNAIISFIELNESEMIRRITRDGLLQTPPNNSFVAPYATSATVVVSTPGISGATVGDVIGFDKLPFIYDNYGCFQIVEINESITSRGWITKMRAVFKLLWLQGDGGVRK